MLINNMSAPYFIPCTVSQYLLIQKHAVCTVHKSRNVREVIIPVHAIDYEYDYYSPFG